MSILSNNDVKKILKKFCEDFIKNPYRCYTEHGIHAYFYSLLMGECARKRISPFFDFKGKKVCAIQKEYPTDQDLGKSRRQHWDIAIIDSGRISKNDTYDHLPVFAAIEFGLNYDKKHLEDDRDRLTDPESNVRNAYIVHLYRCSERLHKKELFSNRDISSKSKSILPPEKIRKMINNYSVTVYYAAVGLNEGSRFVCI